MAPTLEQVDLPIVDWSLIGTDAELELVQQWGTFLASYGFVLIRNGFANSRSSAEQSLTNLERVARKFFEKNSFSVKKHFQLHKVYAIQGYGGPGEINVSGGSEIKRRAPDAVETIHCGCMVEELEKTLTETVPNPKIYSDPNGTPVPGSDDDELRNADEAWYRTAHEELMRKALLLTQKYFGIGEEEMRRAMEGDGGKDQIERNGKQDVHNRNVKKRKMTEYSEDGISPPNCFGRTTINRYLPLFHQNQLCYGEHVDSSMLTIVWRSAWNGLQFLRKRQNGEVDANAPCAQEWIDIPYDEDLILVNAGATLEAMSNGHVKGVIHRVLGPQWKNAASGQWNPEAAAQPAHSSTESSSNGNNSNDPGAEFAPEGWPITITFFIHPANDVILHPFKSMLVEQELDGKYVDPNTKKPFTSLGLRKFKVQRMELRDGKKESDVSGAARL